MLAKCGEVFFAIPLSVLVLLELFSGVDVEWTPSQVKMVKDLDWGHVAVGGVDVIELAVPVFGCNTSEESLLYGLDLAGVLPFLFHALPCVCRCGVSYDRIIVARFHFLDLCQVSEMVVLIFANDLSEESVLIAGSRTGPIVRDVVQFAC